MIADFLASWPLFHHAWLAGACIAALLALVGIHVVAREQVFIGAAVAQAATLGVAAGLWIDSLGIAIGSGHGDDHGHDHAIANGYLVPAILAVLCAVGAALVAADPLRAGRASAESRTGWVFLATWSAGMLLLTHSPHGLHEVEHLVASSLIGAGAGDVWLFGGMLALTAVLAFACRRQLVLLAIDPGHAAAAGMRRALWETCLAVWLGLCLGLAIRAAGLLYVFGCLVLPALAARGLCREVRSQLLVAPLIAILGAGAGFVIANGWDLPPGQAAVAMLCLLSVLSGGWGWWRGRR